MRLSPKAMAISGGLLWGGALLFVGILNLAIPTYGTAFLAIASSVYPWFHGSGTVGDVLIGMADGLVDGAAAGFVFALFYNLIAKQSSSS